jgi:hypothetical protein
MSIQQQEDAASALASLTLQPTQESQDSQESLQPTQETQDSQESLQPTQDTQDTQDSQESQEEMDEDDILQAQLQQSLGGGLAANAIAGELDQHTAQSLAKDKARERKTRPAAGPNYFLKFDPDVPFVPQEFYNMEEGLPPRWDGAGKEDGLDHKDKYESYMSVGNHNTGPAEWASVIKSRAGQDWNQVSNHVPCQKEAQRPAVTTSSNSGASSCQVSQAARQSTTSPNGPS